MGRVLALDYGTKRTGVAVSDSLKLVTCGSETVPTAELLVYLKKYLTENPVDIIVVGMPRQMNGEASQSFGHIKGFVKRMSAEFTEVEIVYHDERFTSVMATRAMIEGGVKKMKRQEKGMVDRVSAAIILQSYLDSSACK